MDRKETGKLGERLALEYLQAKGYTILHQNYRVGRLGEIDLIVSREGRICFVEVKTRTTCNYGTPAEAVSWKKQKTIRQVAACFLQDHHAMNLPVQFDVIEVVLTREGKLSSIRYIEEAF